MASDHLDADPHDPSAHVEWVRKFTRKFAKQFGVSEEGYDELVGIAFLGLVEAAERYDSKKKVPFKAFARYRVRGALLDGMVKIGGLSRSAHRKARALRALTEYREQDEIIRREKATGEQKLAQVFRQASRAAMVYRLSTTAEDGEEFISDDTQKNPEEATEHKELAELLKVAVEKLPERESLVIEEYYFRGLTYDEIGKKYDLSKGWVSKIHSKAVDILQRELEREEEKSVVP
jgi:RNA polymerase sigma factor for flagellar operon FliA